MEGKSVQVSPEEWQRYLIWKQSELSERDSAAAVSSQGLDRQATDFQAEAEHSLQWREADLWTTLDAYPVARETYSGKERPQSKTPGSRVHWSSAEEEAHELMARAKHTLRSAKEILQSVSTAEVQGSSLGEREEAWPARYSLPTPGQGGAREQVEQPVSYALERPRQGSFPTGGEEASGYPSEHRRGRNMQSSTPLTDPSAQEGGGGETHSVAELIHQLQLQEKSRDDKLTALMQMQLDEARKRQRFEQEKLRLKMELERQKLQRASQDKFLREGFQVKLPKLTPEDEISSFFKMVERVACQNQWPKELWTAKLATALSGAALTVYSSLSSQEAMDYDVVKARILERYRVTPEDCRRKLRDYHFDGKESVVGNWAYQLDLVQRWLEPAGKSNEELIELIVLENFINTLPHPVQMWVKEHAPRTKEEVISLTQNFLAARPLANPGPSSNPKYGNQKSWPGKAELKKQPQAKVVNQSQALNQKAEKGGRSQPTLPSADTRKDSQITQPEKGTQKGGACFLCGEKNHYAKNCPNKPKMTGILTKVGEEPGGLGFKTVKINGKQIKGLLDTGSAQSLIHQQYVKRAKTTGEQQLTSVFGESRSVKLVDAWVQVEGQEGQRCQLGVVKNLPVDMILGRDMQCCANLLTAPVPGKPADQEPEKVSAVITRSGKETNPCPKGPSSDVKQKGRKAAAQSPSEEKQAAGGGSTEAKRKQDPVKAFWDVDLPKLQKEDPTLERFWRIRDPKELDWETKPVFTERQDVLFRLSKHPLLGDCLEQVVVPQALRAELLKLAHDVPMAGHLATEKTYYRLKDRFWWPGMYKEVEEYCQSCDTCQKVRPKSIRDKAKMERIPLVPVPFSRLALDIVGPLQKSNKGNRFILVAIDYATRYPEAIPLRTVTAKVIATELVKLFSRMGIPQEILTDQGANFQSALLKHLYNDLGITKLRTSPYHPEGDGLCENLNKTLKRMLKKFAADDPKKWDIWLPYLLFAYREVPQASTGFSPFELLYGRKPRGILDVVKEGWTHEVQGPKNLVEFVITQRDKLEELSKLAQQNLAEAQTTQKRYYDLKARDKFFQAKEKVLLLLPTSENKLLAKWQGPFEILERTGPVNYKIDMGQGKTRIFHVNLLRKWVERALPSQALATVKGTSNAEQAYDSLLQAEDKAGQPEVNPHLSEQQKGDLEKLLADYQDTFTKVPGTTPVTKHAIHTGTAKPIRQRPYRIPERARETLEKEVQNMLQLGVIEPSKSDWSSPIVLVPKPSGEVRFCVDLRKLNQVTKFDSYPMPRIDDLIDQLSGAKYLSTLDLTKGYWQIPLEDEAKEKTAFITPKGLFQFTKMPFGCCGAPATFQRLMDNILPGRGEYCEAYLDDIVIHSATWEEHLKHLREVIEKLRDAGLTINPEKCHLGFTELKYLGFKVGQQEVKPDEKKVLAVKEVKPPTTKKEVRSFLGLVGYYGRFIPHFSSIAAPLTDLLKKECPNKVKWSPECDTAFQELKSILCSQPVLRGPNFKLPFILHCDASDNGLGAVLIQKFEDGEHPILYMSKKLLPREKNYSTIEREAYAVKWAVESLKVYLWGREFTIVTDHKPLVWLEQMKDTNRRLVRWYLTLQPYRFTVKHEAGEQNKVADYLSRYGWDPEMAECHPDVSKQD